MSSLRSQRHYFDNAATSWPKPESVYQAVDDYQRRLGAAAGRGAYRAAGEAGAIVARARAGAAQLLGGVEPRRVIFTLNCTDALNLALRGFLNPGDRVVASVAEHNSVLRPLRQLALDQTVDVAYVDCDSEGRIRLDRLEAALEPRTRLVALVHASNVTGAIQPWEEAVAMAHARGARVLVDAAQSWGHVPLDARRTPVDFVAAPGHKGVPGPLGTGVLYVAPERENELRPTRVGGTGTNSELDLPPDTLPERYEAGNLNVPGLAGLAAACEFVSARGIDSIVAHQHALSEQFFSAIRSRGAIRIYGPGDAASRVGLVSLTIDGYEPQELAAILDASYGIEARAGLHCAPRQHQALGTLDSGGTLRVSWGHFTTAGDIDYLVDALSEIAAG